MRTYKIILLIILTLIVAQLPQHGTAWAQPAPSLMFVENVGQFETDIRYRAYAGPTTLSLMPDGILLSILDSTDNADTPGQGVNLKLTFVDANPQPALEPFASANTHVSYFNGSDPATWQADVPTWRGVRYIDLYPGIDLEITSQNGQLHQRLIQKDATTDLQQVALRVDGADALSVGNDGYLRLTTAVSNVNVPLLQTDNWDTADSPYIEDNIVYHPFTTNMPLFTSQAHIAAATDLIYSTFLGGPGQLDTALSITIDETGHAFVTGQAYAGFPTTPGVFDPTFDGVYSDAFVAKLNPDGTDLIYATLIGGTDYENATEIAIDDAGNAYITGYTTSVDFPTSPGAFDSTLDGESDAFAAKLNTTGTALLFGTYLGGSDDEFCWGLDVDTSGHAYLSGSTPSTDFPTTSGAFSTTLSGDSDVFVTKLNPDAGSLVYSTLVGGTDSDSTGGLAIDSAENAYVTGRTQSADFPVTVGTFDSTLNDQDIFAFKLNTDGSDLIYSTFVGGSSRDYGQDITVDESGNAYLTGNTRSSDFPTTPGAFDTDYNSEPEELEGDSFMAQLNADGSALLYATYLGGSDEDIGHAITLDSTGYVYVTGETSSADYPTTPNAFDPTFNNEGEMFPPRDAFVTKLTTSVSTLSYSTFLGASGYDYGHGIDVDTTGNAYLTGVTSSADFPITEGAFDDTLEGFKDAFVSKLFTGNEPPIEPPPAIPEHDCAPTPLGIVSVGNTPRGIALDVSKNRVYVANYGSNSVSVIDSSSNTVLQNITGVSSANGITYDGLHHMLWVTNYDDDQVTPIEVNQDATGFTVLDPVDVGDGPWGVVFDPIYGYLYVANSLGDSISVIDVAQRTVAATLTEDFSQPYHLATTPTTGKVYAANFGNNTVTVIKGTTIESIVNLWDSQPYGIAVDEARNVVYATTVDTSRIVAIGTLNETPDQFLGWSMFARGFNRNRPLPLRAIAVNSSVGPEYDGGHIWTTTSTSDGSEQNQVLLVPKGWSSYFHVPLPQDVTENPSEGIAVDPINDRVYVSSGIESGIITVIGDHDNICPTVSPASEDTGFGLTTFSRQALSGGDATNDGLIDIFDLAYIAGRYNSTDYTADVNGDGLVDIFDLTFTASRYGQQTSGN